MVILVSLLGCSDDPAKAAPPTIAPVAVLDASPVRVVDERVYFSKGTSIGTRYEWDFGDDTSDEGPEVNHRFGAPGRYTVTLTALAEDGRSDTAYVTVAVVHLPLDPPPVVSGRLARDGARIFAALPDHDQVVIVEGEQVTARLAVCGGPRALSVAGGSLWVACRDDQLQRWSSQTLELELDLSLDWGSAPVAVLSGADGGAAFAGARGLVELDAAGTTLNTLDLADPGALAGTTETRWFSRFRSPDEGGVVSRVRDGAEADFLLVADPGPDSDTDARGLPNLLGALALRPDGRALAVGGTKANIERGLIRDGQAYTFETATRASLRLIDPDTGAALGRALFDNRDRVGALAFTPMGDQLIVVHHGAGVVDLLDPENLTRLGGFQDAGRGLDGVVSDGERVWVLASLDRELRVFSLSGANSEVELARISLADTEPLTAELLLGAQVFAGAADRRMSQDAYISCSSCHPDGGSDGRIWDFTDRGEGMRETQSLTAMPTNGPFHWSANFDEIQDFENAIRDHQAGSGFLDDAVYGEHQDPLGSSKAGLSVELDALTAWLASLPRPRSPFREADGRLTAAAERGRATFEAQLCGDCHGGVEYTDAGWNEDGSPILHDVGTLLPSSGQRAGGPLTGLRTPSLRGLFATSPYLHDGRAAELGTALREHGILLDVAAEADLVSFLLQIE